MKYMVKYCAGPVAGLLLAQAAFAEQLTVEANKSVPVKLRAAASSVVLGNKNIADVAVHDENLIFVTGKSFGTTNLLVFDKAGRQVYATDIVVTANSTSLVTVNRSGNTFTYDCAPQCRSAISPGDDPEYFENLLGQQVGMKQLTEGQ